MEPGRALLPVRRPHMVEVRNVVVDAYGRPVRRPKSAPVAVRRQDEISKTLRCGECLIEYAVITGDRETCPLCDAKRRNADLQSAMTSMRNQMDIMSAELSRLRALTDTIFAIRDAIPVASNRDLTFLKSIFYRYREDASSITLKVVHETRKGKGAPFLEISGLLAVPRHGEPESHICDSIGGLAIAQYFEDEVRRHSLPSAMTTLHQALSDLLAGGS